MRNPFRALASFFTPETKAATGDYTLTNLSGWWYPQGGPSVPNSAPVSPDAAMRLSVAFSCIRILTETIGSLPVQIFEKKQSSADAVEVKDHPLAFIFQRSPNSYMTSVDLIESIALALCQNGNFYGRKETDKKGEVVSINPYDPMTVTPKFVNGDVMFHIWENGRREELPRDKVWQVRGFGNDPLVGLSPLACAARVVDVAKTAENFAARFFEQGGMPSGIVTVDKFLNKEQRAIARDNLQQMMGGLGNAHRFALFEGGMKPVEWHAMPPEDMQLLLTRKFDIQQICRFYRISPHMVADLDRATFSNIEQLSLEFVQYTLLPYFRRIESSASRWLFMPGNDRLTYSMKFNYEGLLRADSTARAAFISSMVQNGIMTRNEGRAKENLPRSTQAGMDSLTAQVNLAPVDLLGQRQSAPAQSVKENPVEVFERVLKESRSAASGHSFNLVIPETVKQHMTQRVEVPGVSELATTVKEANERMSLSNAAVIAHVMELTQETQKRIDRIEELISADREVYFDKDGEPIGTRVVTKPTY